MSNSILQPSQGSIPEGPPEDESKLARRATRRQGLFDPALLKAAFIQSFAMLRPDIQWKNPVMFVVEVGTVLTFIFTISEVGTIPLRANQQRPVGDSGRSRLLKRL